MQEPTTIFYGTMTLVVLYVLYKLIKTMRTRK